MIIMNPRGRRYVVRWYDREAQRVRVRTFRRYSSYLRFRDFLKQHRYYYDRTQRLWVKEKTRVWRYAYGVKLLFMGEDPEGADDEVLHVIPIHTNVIPNNYFGAIIMGWMLERDEGVAFDLQRRLIRTLEDFTGYPEGEWWFLLDDGWGWQSFYVEDWEGFDMSLIGKYYIRIEREDGRAFYEDWGRIR
jgi:hypothetical protein